MFFFWPVKSRYAAAAWRESKEGEGEGVGNFDPPKKDLVLPLVVFTGAVGGSPTIVVVVPELAKDECPDLDFPHSRLSAVGSCVGSIWTVAIGRSDSLPPPPPPPPTLTDAMSTGKCTTRAVFSPAPSSTLSRGERTGGGS